jgi:hypothetical protein
VFAEFLGVLALIKIQPNSKGILAGCVVGKPQWAPDPTSPYNVRGISADQYRDFGAPSATTRPVSANAEIVEPRS